MKLKIGLLGVAALCGTLQALACTGISLTAADGSYVQSRTIEWGNSALESMYVIIPRGQALHSLTPTGGQGLAYTARYGVVGLAVVEQAFIAEGINEAGLSAGLFFFQIAQGDEYVKLASRNRLRILRISAPRGSILDINGAPLAVNVRTFNLSGYPVDLQKDENVKATAALLTRSGIPMDEARLRELVDKQYSAPYRAITVATNLTFAQVAEMIMDRDFKKALFITPVWKRTYPAAQYAAHVVGYVAEITKEELETRDRELYRGGDMIGKNGIEREYEDVLRGAAGEEVIEVDSRGRRLRNISYVKTQKGGDMTLTIDLAAQRYAAELMGKFRGALIAMDVRDGSIRCLYSSPSYDPNPLTWGISNKEWAALTDHVERPMMNRAISGAYPPASTFKVITGTAILENKIANRNTKINCPGWFELGNRRFRCWKRSGHGKENVTDSASGARPASTSRAKRPGRCPAQSGRSAASRKAGTAATRSTTPSGRATCS